MGCRRLLCQQPHGEGQEKTKKCDTFLLLGVKHKSIESSDQYVINEQRLGIFCREPLNYKLMNFCVATHNEVTACTSPRRHPVSEDATQKVMSLKFKGSLQKIPSLCSFITYWSDDSIDLCLTPSNRNESHVYKIMTPVIVQTLLFQYDLEKE